MISKRGLFPSFVIYSVPWVEALPFSRFGGSLAPDDMIGQHEGQLEIIVTDTVGLVWEGLHLTWIPFNLSVHDMFVPLLSVIFSLERVGLLP